MDMDPAERGGVEWVSEFCPVKGSSPNALKSSNFSNSKWYKTTCMKVIT